MRSACVAIAGQIAIACSVTRRSEQLACSSSNDCSDGRTCMQGYCVLGTAVDARGPTDARPDSANNMNCPSECTSCDVAMMTCNITGGIGNNVNCPAGWNCTIDCAAPGSCGTVSCNNAMSCTVTCSGTGACNHVQCGNAKCDVTCSGIGGCGQVSCQNSCQCDVTCTSPSDCGNLQCPQLGGNQYCTTNGSNGQPCSSSFNAQCAQC